MARQAKNSKIHAQGTARMKIVQIYGIKNCDTMKKALRWLDKRGISYDFHNYKKQGADAAVLQAAFAAHGWQNIINRRGTSWRALPDEIKDTMNEKTALEQALQNPSLIRRPLLVLGGNIYLGFTEDDYRQIFS